MFSGQEGDFGSTEAVLLAQEEKLAAAQSENQLLGRAVEQLKEKLARAEVRAATAQRRAADAEAKLHSQQLAKAAADAAERSDSQELRDEVQRLKRKVANDRILLEQAERFRRDVEQQLAASRQGGNEELAAVQQHATALEQENADLQQRLAAALRQVRQLESLQSFADSWEEQQRHEQQLEAALAQANQRVRSLEGRCASLEQEMQLAADALQAAQQLAGGGGGDGGGGQQQAQRQRRGPGGGQLQQLLPQQQQLPPQQQQLPPQQQQLDSSLQWSDLCDLDGCSSPSRSIQSTGSSDAHDVMPSRRRVLNALDRSPERQQRQAQAHGRQEQEQQGSLVADLQQQLLELQREMALMQVQQQVQQQRGPVRGSGAADQQLAAGKPGGELEQQVEKLKHRNTQLQSALAETSLQHARDLAAAHKQLQEVQQEAAVLRQRYDEAQRQLGLLQMAAAAAGDGQDGAGGAGGSGSSSSGHLEQLHEELLEYASRCNAAVEQNAGLLQEKKQWLEKLRAAEAEVERCRTEAHQLRLQRLQLLPATSSASGSGSLSGLADSSSGSAGGGALGIGEQQSLLQLLLDAQAAEAALRSVLGEARQEQVSVCKALSGELRRVHALERLRISDMQEVHRLQRRVQELQRDCQQLSKALAAAQQQVYTAAATAAAGNPKSRVQLDGWPVQQQAGGQNFSIPAYPGGAAAQ